MFINPLIYKCYSPLSKNVVYTTFSGCLVCIHTHTHTPHTHTYTHKHKHTQARMRARARTHARTHARRTRACMHARTHTQFLGTLQKDFFCCSKATSCDNFGSFSSQELVPCRFRNHLLFIYVLWETFFV